MAVFAGSLARALPDSWQATAAGWRRSRRPPDAYDSLLNPDLVRGLELPERLARQREADLAALRRGERHRLWGYAMEDICSASSAYNRVAGRSGVTSADPFRVWRFRP